jgi:hypothetical protein
MSCAEVEVHKHTRRRKEVMQADNLQDQAHAMSV